MVLVTGEKLPVSVEMKTMHQITLYTDLSQQSCILAHMYGAQNIMYVLIYGPSQSC